MIFRCLSLLLLVSMPCEAAKPKAQAHKITKPAKPKKPKACSKFGYSNCPTDRCRQQCVPSTCGSGPDAMCTDDCSEAGGCTDKRAN